MSKGKLLAVCCVWLALVGVGAMVWRLWLTPAREAEERAAQQAKEAEILKGTSEPSHYKHTVAIALDSFSGYCLLRSATFRQQLSSHGIKLELQDDGADYTKRLDSLKKGQVQMAAFTVDALIKTSAERGEIPATIVAVMDETRGADAMVAYKQLFPDVDSLNKSNAKIVLTPDSPSETLARVMMADFHLENLGSDPFIEAKDAEDVFNRYKASKPNEAAVYVLWEPYVSKVLENPNTHVLIDSSRFRGFIVDVLVADRDWLIKNQEVAEDVITSYFRAFYEHRDQMTELVKQDADALDTPLSDDQATRLVEGIWWKNTQENYMHFGLAGTQQLQLLEDSIANITRVLKSTGAIAADPTDGQPNLLLSAAILRKLQSESWHPGLEKEAVRDDKLVLPPLTESQWERIKPVGHLRVPALVFGRGSDRLTGYSQTILDDLIGTLENWPQYYVLIRGNALQEADRPLAEARAKRTADYLIEQGIHANRIRAVGVEPSGSTSVSVVVGQTPY